MKSPFAPSHAFINFFATKFTYRQRFLLLALVYLTLAPLPVYWILKNQQYLFELQTRKIEGVAYQTAFHNLINLIIEQELIHPELSHTVSENLTALKNLPPPVPLSLLGNGFSSQKTSQPDVEAIEKAWKSIKPADLSPLTSVIYEQIPQIGYQYFLLSDTNTFTTVLAQLILDKLNIAQLLAASFFLEKQKDNTSALKENTKEISRLIQEAQTSLFHELYEDYSHALEDLLNSRHSSESLLIYLNANKKLHRFLSGVLDAHLKQQYHVELWKYWLFILLILISTTVIVFFVVFRILSSHLVQLKNQIQNILQETSLKESTYHHEDEFGKVSQAFAWLGSTVREIVKEIHILSKQLVDSIVQINGAAGDGKILLSNQEIKIYEIEETASLIGDRAHKLAVHTTEIINSSFQAQLAEETKGHLESITQKLNFLAAESKGLLNNLVNLQEKVGKMETLTSFMTRISDQANLLALNAAIETANVNTYRSSFSEITINIQRFSKNTTVSTQDIEKIVKEILETVNKVRKEANHCLIEINQWAKKLITIGAQLSGIAEQGRRQIQNIEKISTTVTEQAASAEEIRATIKRLSRDARENSAFLVLIPSVIGDLDKAAAELQSLLTKIPK